MSLVDLRLCKIDLVICLKISEVIFFSFENVLRAVKAIHILTMTFDFPKVVKFLLQTQRHLSVVIPVDQVFWMSSL